MMGLRGILAKYLTANKVDGICLTKPDREIRESLRILGVLRDIRGAKRSLIIEIDPIQALELGNLLIELGTEADLKQKQVKIDLRKKLE